MRFLLQPKRAHVIRCRNCSLELWFKSKYHNPYNVCPTCETKSSLFVPDDIPAIKLEQMYRFLDDEDKIDRLELEHDTLMEKYNGFGCGCPCDACNDEENDDGFQYGLSDEIRERLT